MIMPRGVSRTSSFTTPTLVARLRAGIATLTKPGRRALVQDAARDCTSQSGSANPMLISVTSKDGRPQRDDVVTIWMIWAHCRQLQHQQLQFTDQTAASFWSRPPPTTSNVLVPGTHRRNHHQAATAVPKRVFDAKEPRRHPVAGEPGSRCRSKPRSGPLRPTIIGVLAGSLLGNADGFPDRHGTPRWRTEICDVLTVRAEFVAAECKSLVAATPGSGVLTGKFQHRIRIGIQKVGRPAGRACPCVEVLGPFADVRHSVTVTRAARDVGLPTGCVGRLATAGSAGQALAASYCAMTSAATRPRGETVMP